MSFLAGQLGKPVLVEGPAGVGKTELAKALSRATGRELIRLQCYEGLDEAKALYEWNYRKQLLRIQTEAADTGWQEVKDDIFGEEFLLARPLLNAISADEPVVLLIDEIDKTDQEFEAMLLEVLSDFQISIPELGVVEATHPSARAAHLEQLARADRGAQAPLPLPLARLPDGRARARDRPPARARARRRDRAQARRGRAHGPRARPEEAALDRRVDRLGAGAAAARRRGHRPGDARADDVDHRQAPHRPGPGGRARGREARRWHPRAPSAPAERGPPGPLRRHARSPRGRRAWRRACSSSPTSCATRAWRSAPRSCSTPSRRSTPSAGPSQERLPRGARGHAGQVPGGPARARRAVRPLLLPRGGARGRGARAHRGALPGRRGRSTSTPCASASAKRSGPATTARCATSPGSRSPPSGARARAPA